MLFISMGDRAERWVEVANVKRYLKRKSLVVDFCSLNMTKKRIFGEMCRLSPPPRAPRGCSGNRGTEAIYAGQGLQKAVCIFQKAALDFQSLRLVFQKAGLKIQSRALAGRGTDTEKPFTRRLPRALGPGSRRERFCYCSKAGAAAVGASARPQLAGKISGGGSGSSPLRCWDRGCRCFHRLPKWTS